MSKKNIKTIAGELGDLLVLFIFLLVVFTGVAMLCFWPVGVWHAHAKHGFLNGLASSFPPVGVYYAYDKYYGDPHGENYANKREPALNPAAIMLHIEDPVLGRTQISVTNPENPSMDECKSMLKGVQNDIFKSMKQENPALANAKLLKAECVDETSVMPEKIERPEDYVEPIVTMAIQMSNGEAGMFFFPTPIEGMGLKECNEFMKSGEGVKEWKKFAHESLKARSPGIFNDSVVLSLACITPTQEMLKTIQGQR